MEAAYICDAIRTPIGRYGGSLASIRADDLAAIPIAALVARNAGVDWNILDDVIFGCANQAGEDNRNVARMALLLAGLPKEVPGSTVNRLCGSSMEAVARRGARHQERRSRPGDCRRRGKHVARAVCRGQSGCRVFARHENGRHHHGLALCESADESEVWNRYHAGNRRDRGRRI